MKKTPVERLAPSEESPFLNLVPLVQALIADGNTLSPAIGNYPTDISGFYLDKSGWNCDLTKPLNFELIESQFELPETIVLNRTANTIFDSLSWTEIRGNVT